MSEFSVRRPISVLMICLGLLVLGLISYQKIPLELMPKMDLPEIVIRTEMKGAAPSEIEESVTIPLERAVSTVPGLVQTTSSSERERSEILLRFRTDVSVLDTLSLLRDRIDGAGLPDAAGRPRVQKSQASGGAVLRIGVSPLVNVDLTEAQEDLQTGLSKELEKIPGVAVVLMTGLQEKRLEVSLDPLLTQAMGLQPAQIAGILKNQNRTQSGGEIEMDGQKISVKIGDRLRSLEELLHVVVHVDQGKIVRLSDIAQVREIQMDVGARARVNGVRGFEVEVYKENQANAVQLNEQLRRYLRDNSSLLNKKYQIQVTWDQGQQIEQALEGVFSAVITGGLLTAFAIFVFLQSLWSTFVVSIVIPIALLLTLIMMYFAGMSFNLMSLSGLALGVGMLVDNAIVVLESIKQRQLTSDDPEDAAIWGTRRVMGAVFASTMSNVAVFGPLIFVEGKIGQIFKDISLAIVFSNFAALFVALLVVPALCGSKQAQKTSRPSVQSFGSWLIGEIQRGAFNHRSVVGSQQSYEIVRLYLQGLGLFYRGATHVVRIAILRVRGYLNLGLIFWNKLIQPVQARSNWMVFHVEAFFDRVIPWSIRFGNRVVLGIVGLTAASVLVFSQMGAELFPDNGTTRFEYELSLAPGTVIEAGDRILKDLGNEIQKLPGVQSTLLKVGVRGSHVSRMVILSSESESENMVGRLGRAFQRIPNLEVRRVQDTLVGQGLPVEVLVYADQEIELRRGVNIVLEKMNGISGLQEVQSSLKPAVREVAVSFDRQKLDAYQQDPSQWVSTLKPYFQPQSAGVLTMSRGDLPVSVRMPASAMNELDRIESFFQNVEDKRVYLAEISNVGLHWVSSSIERQDRKRVARVFAGLNGLDLDGAAQQIKKSLANEKNLIWAMGGQEKERSATQRSLLIAIALSIFLIYLILASQFQNLSQPLLVLVAIPLCLIGVVVLLLIAGLNVSALVLVGFVILVGTSVNTSIILVDTANQMVREGIAPSEACRRAAIQRLRPILMSSGASIIGLVPLALKLGEGSASQQPLALTMIGGLLSSTVLTLVLLPIIYQRTQSRTTGAV